MNKRFFYVALTATLGAVLSGVFGCSGGMGGMGGGAMGGGGPSAGCGYPQVNCAPGYTPAPGGSAMQCVPVQQAGGGNYPANMPMGNGSQSTYAP
jgi:hypothetical protein